MDTLGRRRFLELGGCCVAGALGEVAEAAPVNPLAAYRTELDKFRRAYGGARNLPDARFFLFGMGHRTKLLYRSGRLMEAPTGKILREWKIASDRILPGDYRVDMVTADRGRVSVREDQQGVWLDVAGKRELIPGTGEPVRLPDFAGHPFRRVLRVLHQELLFNLTPAGPVPNLFAYSRPWYRDSAMMAMAYRRTGNLDLLKNWIMGLRDPYDRNNGGEAEADNLGQLLFLISLVSDRHHPLVGRVLAELSKFEITGPDGKYIRGRTDFAEHPVYQTKWLKFGLKALGLPDPYTIPRIKDGYSALFWMDFRDSYVPGGDSDDRGAYPYLGWACAHFHGTKDGPVSVRDYPLTWEKNASQANYDGLKVIDPLYTTLRLATPHTWHAAEVFLYLTSETAA